MFEPGQTINRNTFLNFAALFEGGLLVVAFGVGWIVEVNPVEHLTFSWTAFGVGLVATLPMLLIFLIGERVRLQGFQRIRSFMVDMLGPYLDVCRWYDLLLLAAVVGLCEELLFRGLLQSWIGRLGHPAGIIGSNILFGLAHCVTPLYAVWAGLIGVYLALLLGSGGRPGLLAPMTAHAAYDFVGFLIVVRAYRNSPAGTER